MVQVAAGGQHTLLLMDDGTVKAFGSNSHGQLGTGSSMNVARLSIPTDIPGVRRAKRVAAGRRHSLILLDGGTVLSFGSNTQGQLGHGDSSPQIFDKSEVRS